MIFKYFYLVLILSLTLSSLSGQNATYDYFYRIYLRDKGENHVSDFTPSELFTPRAIERRQKNGITGLNDIDLPVYSGYLDNISSTGLKLHCTSRWMNTAVFKSFGPFEINSLLALPFVIDVKIVKNPVTKGQQWDKFALEIKDNPYIYKYNNHILMVNGEKVQGSGFQGWGILIAVLDGGFIDFDKLPALETIRLRNGVKGTYDFVEKNRFVYDYHIHGSDIMCVLSGDVQGQIAGSGPGADFLLIRTENTSYEYPVEQDFWAAGAEYADSAGCDIITSSLGYFTFDDPTMDYKYSDLDGKTAFITLAAEAAVSRGIVVVNSAGNERNTSWRNIMVPSDGLNVISVGAVDWMRNITVFSSAGPSSDGRIKPDVVTQGAYIPVQELVFYEEWGVTYPEIMFGFGTSFSCPLISGMIACLMQAVPEAKVSEIISTIREVSDRYNSPDNDYGYGIPDMVKAVNLLEKKFMHEPNGAVAIGPNPFSENINITFANNPEWINIEVFDAFGRLIWTHFYSYIGLTFTLDCFQKDRPGIYFLRLRTSKGQYLYKLLKANKL
jgi:serine protease AprX